MKKKFTYPDYLFVFPSKIARSNKINLNPVDVLVFSAIYSRYLKIRQSVSSNDEAYVCVTRKKLAAEIGISVSALSRSFDKLHDARLVYTKNVGGGSGRIYVRDPEGKRNVEWLGL